MIHRAWREKERWTGCQEVIDDVQQEWDQAEVYLKACAKLGSAEPAILSVLHLCRCQAQWMHIEELRRQHLKTRTQQYHWERHVRPGATEVKDS
jgi:hypothetical protein